MRSRAACSGVIGIVPWRSLLSPRGKRIPSTSGRSERRLIGTGPPGAPRCRRLSWKEARTAVTRDRRDVFIVPETTSQDAEAIGARDKFWFTRDDARWLFKKTRPQTQEDLAEVLAELAATALGLPCAEYQFAVHLGREGVISRSFHSVGQNLILGNELLFTLDPEYPVPDANSRFIRPARHTIDAVLAVLDAPDIDMPGGWEPPPGVASAVDVFGGYLLLDAWIGNTDRHHQNWGLLQEGLRPIRRLVPTFDHSSSLGAHETDAKRRARLRTRDQGYDVDAYVRRAESPFYLGPGRDALTPLEAWLQWTRRRPNRSWLGRLEALGQREIQALIDRLDGCPRASGPALAFASAMLVANRRRILEAG